MSTRESFDQMLDSSTRVRQTNRPPREHLEELHLDSEDALHPLHSGESEGEEEDENEVVGIQRCMTSFTEHADVLPLTQSASATTESVEEDLNLVSSKLEVSEVDFLVPLRNEVQSVISNWSNPGTKEDKAILVKSFICLIACLAYEAMTTQETSVRPALQWNIMATNFFKILETIWLKEHFASQLKPHMPVVTNPALKGWVQEMHDEIATMKDAKKFNKDFVNKAEIKALNGNVAHLQHYNFGRQLLEIVEDARSTINNFLNPLYKWSQGIVSASGRENDTGRMLAIYHRLYMREGKKKK